MVVFSSCSGVSRRSVLAAAAASLLCSLQAWAFDFWAIGTRLGTTAASTTTATASCTASDTQAEQLAVPIRTDALTGRDAGDQGSERRHPNMAGPECLGQREHGIIVPEG
jgi:hypothetical protein